MGKLQIKTGDLLDASERYLCHQCNSMTTSGANLARSVFARFPHADIYKPRRYAKNLPLPGETPGNIIIRGDGHDQRFVINMIGQFYPGKPKYPDSIKDGCETRQRYFQECLEKILQISDLGSIALPYQIGCGAAGGDWRIYFFMLQQFSKKINVPISLYKL